MSEQLPDYPADVQIAREKRMERGGALPLDIPLDELRPGFVAALLSEAGPPVEVASVEELEYDGPAGPQAARLYKPDVEWPPLLVYFHGGGWVLGSLDTVDTIARSLAEKAGVAVLSCRYRLAPEHPFPAAADDAEAAVRWAALNGTRLGVDSSRLAVGGDSAGGNLSAVVALRLRDSGGPPLAFQLLIYPVIQHEPGTRSSREVTDPLFLTDEVMRWFWGHYLADPADGRDPSASPLMAESLEGLPPALVITAEHDPLLDEGEEYAKRLADAGVQVTLSRYDGMVHGFFPMTLDLAAAHDAHAEAAAALRNVLQARR